MAKGQATEKPKIIALRFVPNDSWDQALLRELNEIQPFDRQYEGRLSTKARGLLDMILGVRPMSPELAKHFRYVEQTQDQRWPSDRWEEWPCKPEPVEQEPIRPGLRLVK
jgi:hypothetical protein